MTGGGRGQAELQARQANNTHTSSSSSTHSLQSTVCSSFAVLAHCQCIQRDYFAVYFARVSFQERERGSVAEGGGRHGSWLGVYSILNFCHFAMSIVVVVVPRPLLVVGTKLAAFQQRCNICFVWLAAYPLHILPPNCSAPSAPHSALLLLAAKAPASYSLCHRIASNNFASVSACHTPLPASPGCLVVCFSRPSKRFAHLPVYMCCAVVGVAGVQGNRH